MASKYLVKGLKRSVLTVALGLCFAGGVHAQSTTGAVRGTVPGGEGATVTITNNSGFNRTVSTDASGRFNASTLPVGNYTVTAERGGQTVGTRTVTVLAGAGAELSFGDTATLDTVTVVGTGSVTPIDITTVDTRSVVTAEQLQRLPLNRTAESIALLAPGAVSGASGFFGGLVSFGGSGVSENAYYVNGYFTGEPLSNLGGFSLPYGAIEQQETYIGGYSAKYGRSDGGVISQIGKRGTNEWKFGGQVVWEPKSLHTDEKNEYFPNSPLPAGYEYEEQDLPGSLYERGNDEVWGETYNAYIGGPIIKDRLFAFLAAEMEVDKTVDTPNALQTFTVENKTENPKVYGKIDWSITDNHFLEFTYLGEKTDREGDNFNYDFENGVEGSKAASFPDSIHRKNEYLIGKYTGYLTDNLTFSALYGKSQYDDQVINPSIIPGVAFIGAGSFVLQDPSITGGNPIRSPQGGWLATDAVHKTESIRADLEWVLGDHTLTFGVDNIKFEAENAGTAQVANRWDYGRLADPTDNINSPLGVGSPGGDGYYVIDRRQSTATSMELDQKAWYIEDRWQLTDNLLLSLGVRNDQFTNKNNVGEAYMDAKDQWAPRLGASWDVFGDSSMKIFGNVGRYFLAMPNNVAVRGASASILTAQYYTYTGIDGNGSPTGLTPVPGVDGAPPPGPTSANGEFGQPIDVLSFAPKDLKNMYQDEYIFGMEKTLGDSWMVGVKLTHRELKSAIDDICDPAAMEDALTARGIDPESVEIPGCFMFNPGGTNTFSLAKVDGTGRVDVTMSRDDWGFDQDMKRTYDGIDIYFERPFDGTWEARIDYTFSKSRGNTEGQVKSEFGQANISKTQDWDVAEMMQFAHGYLANDRRHQLKMRGSYQISPEWLVGANFRVESGGPISCLGFFNPDGSIDEDSPEADPVGYGASYHTCFGQVATPGSKRLPWTKKLDLGVTYRPAFLNDKVSFGVQVINVLNDRKPLQVDVTSENAGYTVSNTYLLPLGRQTPRYVMLTAGVDF